MYAVRDRKSKEIIHINPAPLEQALEGEDVYFNFDASSMEIGRIEGPLPEYFDITPNGEIVELDFDQRVKAGLIELESHEKIGNGEIVEKSLAEKAADGLIKLEPDQKVEDDQIVAKTQAELLQQGLISLDEIKHQRKVFYSTLALQKRGEILPDFKIQNALMGIYDDATTSTYKKTIETFRKEYHRLEALVDAADSLQALEKIKPRYSEAFVGTSEKSTLIKKITKPVKATKRSPKSNK